MVNSSAVFNPYISNQSLGTGLHDNAQTNTYNSRTRGIVQLDARTHTEYGTLRSFVDVGANMDSWQKTNGDSAVNLQHALVQWAGLTTGYTASLFRPNLEYLLTKPLTQMNRKVNLVSYTSQLGNGLSASVSVEDGRFHSVLNSQALGSALAAANANNANVAGGSEVPDFVGTLHLKQNWGMAQLSLAAHQSRVALEASTMNASSSQWGWAIGGTVELNLPQIADGDTFYVSTAYADGAMNYVGFNGAFGSPNLATQFGRVNAGGNSAFYQLSDVVYNDLTGGMDTTQAWSITGQFRHFWTPSLRSAVLAGYASVSAPDSAYASQNGFVDFHLWQAGFNTTWSPVRNVDIAAEVVYSKVDGSQPYGYNLNTQHLAISKNQSYGGMVDTVSGGLRIMRTF